MDKLDPTLKFLNNDNVDRILARTAKKSEIIRARILFEARGQVPSPSKDYSNIIITEKGVIWRRWKITLRGVTSGTAPMPQPIEEMMTYAEYKEDDSLQEDIKRIFGEAAYEHIDMIISGCNDNLSCISKELMMSICGMLDLQSISHLSQVNRYMRRLCRSDRLWNTLYSQHQGNPTPETCSLAKELSWKEVFYMSKLQLQKELSRRRKSYTGSSENS